MTKKIIFFYQSPEISGGVDTVLISSIRAWPSRDDAIEVWLNKGHKGPYLYDAEGIALKRIDLSTIEDINLRTDRFFQVVLRKFLRLFWRIFKYPYFFYSVVIFYFKLRKSNPDVVFSHNGGYPAGDLNRAFVIAAKCAGIEKIFLVVHNYAMVPRFPSVLIEHWLDKLVDGSCSRIISVSASCARQLQEIRFPRAKKIEFIYNGVVVDKTAQIPLADKKKKLNLDGKSRVIGCIGDYEERKGHEYLIRAFYEMQNDVPDSRLIIIGSSSSSHWGVLKKFIQELRLEEKVFLTGYLDSAWEYIECFEVFVFPSIAYESFGMVLLEAMLYKKPVIASNVGGIPEVLADTGVIVESKDPSQLARAIKQVLGNKNLAKDLGEKGYSRVIGTFRAEFMAKKYYDVAHG